MKYICNNNIILILCFLSISNSLFDEQSYYVMNDIVLKRITTNSKALLYFIYNNVSLNNIEAKDIKCVGDNDNSSFILFDGGDYEKEISINNLIISNNVSNGPFIKIVGQASKLIINDSNIDNIKSAGPIIEIKSKEVLFILINY